MTDKDKVPTTIEGMIIKIAFGNIDTLKNLLREHGGHKKNCSLGKLIAYCKIGKKCDCGWAEIDKALGKVND